MTTILFRFSGLRMLRDGNLLLPDDEAPAHQEEALPALDERLLDLLYTQEGEEEEEEGEELRTLFRAWLNERMSPTLLPPREQLCNDLIQILTNQELWIEHVRRERNQEPYVMCIYQMEMERVKYVFSSYIRARLAKLELHWQYYTNLPMADQRVIMMTSEIQYVRQYAAIRERALREAVLTHLASGASDFPLDDATQPPPNRHVIIRVVKDIGLTQIDDTYATEK